MSPKDFRKIDYPELELKTNEVSGDKQTDGKQMLMNAIRRMQPLLELTPQGVN